MKKMSKKVQATVVAVSTMMISGLASAATAPADPNSLGGQAYELFFTQAYDSGIAYIISGCMMLFGFMQLKTNWKETAGFGVGAGGVATLPGILTAIGATI